MSEQRNWARELALAVFAANGRLITAGNELVAHLGLTSAWWQVLAALRYAPQPLTTASIARNMGLSRQAVQRIVDLLAERQLVELRPNPHHLRAKLVVLTSSGAEAVAGAEKAAAPIDQAIAERTGDRRLQEAVKTLEEMVAVISDMLGAPHHRTSLDEKKEQSS